MDQPSRMECACSIRRPLEFVSERIDRADHRFAPGHELSWTRFGAWRVHELRIFSRQTRGASQRLGPGFDFAGDLSTPLSAVRRNLEGNERALYAADLAPCGKERCDKRGDPSDLTTENPGEHFSLALVSALVDENACAPL